MKFFSIVAAGTAFLAACALIFVLHNEDGSRYRMMSAPGPQGTGMYLLDGRSGKTWQLVTVEDDPTGSSDFWSPIDRMETRDEASRRLEATPADGGDEAAPKQPISLRLPAPGRASGVSF